MSEVPLAIMAKLCTRCEHGMKCTDPRPQSSAGGGVTCLSYAPERGDPLKPEHVMVLPDREPCEDCACRKGTVPNGTHHSFVDLTACADRLEPFLCHDGGAGRVCAGWLRMAKSKVRDRARIGE